MSKVIEEQFLTGERALFGAEDRVELEHRQRVHREFSATSKGETSEFEYGSLERILSRQNLYLAMYRVVSNKGSHGFDGMMVYEP